MKGRRGFTLIELLVVIAIIAILAAILFPVFAKARRNAQTSNCASNLTQIGRAFKMYLSDWEDTFPTNYNNASGASTPGKNVDMPLSINSTTGTYGDAGAPKIDPGTGKPIRFVGISAGSSMTPNSGTSGPNWVEGLYNYIEVATIMDDPSSIWKCQSAVVKARITKYGLVTYIMNACLVECGESAIRSSSNTMLLREGDGMYRATVRPSNAFTVSFSASTPPENTFLNSNPGKSPDTYTANGKLHGTGSHILFADGHVKLFDQGYYPSTPELFTENGSPDNGQWFNFASGDKAKSIAITP